MIYVLLLILSFLLSLTFTPIARSLAQKNNILDIPNARKVHKTPVPLLGGLAIFCSFWGSIFLAQFIPVIRQALIKPVQSWIGLILGSLIVMGIGSYDDCRHINPRQKILFQSVAAGSLIIGFGFQIRMVSNPFGTSPVDLGWLSIPLTFFWVVGITNALNIVDGLDGLASGVSAIAGLAIFAIACKNQHPMAAFLSLILVGDVLGFLVYNFHPASIFLGDSGSLFLGFWLSFLSVQGIQSKQHPVVPIAVPLMILGFPIVDTLLAIVRRFFQPNIKILDKIRLVFKADQGHLHHKLLERGFSQRLAVLVLYCLCLSFAGCGLCAVFLPWVNQRVLGLFLLPFCLFMKNMAELKTADQTLPQNTPLSLVQESKPITLKGEEGIKRV